MIRFIHTADIHFGVENYGKIDPETGIHTRLLDFEKALNLCIDKAISEDVDFFLFAGDAYKTATPSPTQQRLLLRCFLRLYKAKIPVILVIGNHDNPLSFGKAHALDLYNELPVDGFYVVAKPQIIPLTTKSGLVNIVGIPWPTRNTIALSDSYAHKNASEITEYISQSVAQIIQHLANQLDPSIPAVLSGHLTVSNGIFSGSEKRAVYGTDPLFLPSQLAISPFDYVGLGHLHRFQNLNPHGIPVIYSGSIERVDFGERKEEKGFCLITLEKKGSTKVEFIEVPTRPFKQIEVHLNAQDDQTQQVLSELKKHTIDGAVIKILYHLPPGKKDLLDLQTVQKACSQAMYCTGIIPIKKIEQRQHRQLVKIDMDLKTLLTSYFETKIELTQKKESLIEKALLLQQNIEQEIEI
jgi:exonuclease SbcD